MDIMASINKLTTLQMQFYKIAANAAYRNTQLMLHTLSNMQWQWLINVIKMNYDYKWAIVMYSTVAKGVVPDIHPCSEEYLLHKEVSLLLAHWLWYVE